jgi:hypothetical protein
MSCREPTTPVPGAVPAKAGVAVRAARAIAARILFFIFLLLGFG